MCAINRSSIYILLLIQLHLCDLTRNLFCMIYDVRQNALVFKIISVGLPVLLMFIAYGVETDDVDSDNFQLNVARHAFSCTMRFSDMATEWGLLWIHFTWSGAFTIIFCLASWWKIGKAVALAGGTSKAAKSTSGTNRARSRLLRTWVPQHLCPWCLMIGNARRKCG